jgi:hypothetical protein
MATTHARVHNLGLQLAVIRHAFPAAIGHVQRSELVCTVPLQPTAASRTYTVRWVGLAERPAPRPAGAGLADGGLPRPFPDDLRPLARDTPQQITGRPH